ncbi:BTB domain-containing protein [Mycena venus]|uniref:BTB domain-containing protein n=1 Tax=Mycena venus TaxID=2733690 RepID=A0A8H7CZ77_9AGAR|nr:BTB domain-containing protein [Mycena venus]
MWPHTVSLSLLALVGLIRVSAQGEDAASITSSLQTITKFADFNIEWASNKGTNVIDIMFANVSSVPSPLIEYTVFPGIAAGPYHVRLSGTIFNGNTALSGTSALSNTFTILNSGVPCSAGTFTPVTSISDLGYNPVRIASPEGADVIMLFTVTNPNGQLVVIVTAVDVTFDTTLAPATLEVINAKTGFNAGVQHANLVLDSPMAYTTNNLTLDPGAWKFRVNFTILSPASYPGAFSLESQPFFIVPDGTSTPDCSVLPTPTPRAAPSPTPTLTESGGEPITVQPAGS